LKIVCRLLVIELTGLIDARHQPHRRQGLHSLVATAATSFRDGYDRPHRRRECRAVDVELASTSGPTHWAHVSGIGSFLEALCVIQILVECVRIKPRKSSGLLT